MKSGTARAVPLFSTFSNLIVMYNNYGGGGRNYGNRGYNGRNRQYDSQYAPAPRYRDERPKKRSGAKYGISPKTKRPYIQGWKATKDGMVKIIAGPTKKGMVSDQSEQWVCNVTIGYAKPVTMTAFYNVNSKKLTIPDMSFVLNPGAPNGGYCGPFYKSRR